MRIIATTTNYGLYLNDDDSETFISWRNKINGDTGESNMDIIDEALGDFSSHVSDSDIHVTDDEKELWGSNGFSWNLLKDTKTLSDWTRSSTSGITLEEDDDGFYAAYFVGSSSTRTRFIRNYVTYEDIAGKECTFSFMGKSDYADSIVEDGGLFRVYARTYSSTTSSSYSGSVIYTLSSQDITTEWAKFSVTFTYTNSSASDDSPIYICINNYSYYDAEIKCPKLEFGSSATEWTPHISETGDNSSSSDSSGTTDLTEDVTGILPVVNGGTGNSSGTAAGLTTAVDLSIDLSTAGTVSFDGTADTTIPVSSSSGALPIEYGGTNATDAEAAAVNLLYRTEGYSEWATGFRIPVIDSSKRRNIYSAKLLNSILLESTEITSTTLDDYASYYFPMAASRNDNTADDYDNGTYKIAPSSLLEWIEDNITVSSDGTSTTGTVDLTSSVDGILPIENGGTGNSTGTATYATQLETARSIQVDLTSTDAASFDGTADITPGVTGTLPIGYGGTGGTTASSALVSLVGSSTAYYYLSPSTYYVPLVSSSYGRRISLSRLINSAVAGGTDADLDAYSSYFIPLVSGTATSSSSSDNGTYRFTPADLLEWIQNNSSTSSSSSSGIVAGTYDGEEDYDSTGYKNVVSFSDQAALAIVGALNNYSTRYGTRPQWLFYVDDDASIIMETCFGYTLYDGTTDYDWYGKAGSSSSDSALYFYHSSSGTMHLRARNLCYENTSGDSYETSFNLDGITYFYIIIYL